MALAAIIASRSGFGSGTCIAAARKATSVPIGMIRFVATPFGDIYIDYEMVLNSFLLHGDNSQGDQSASQGCNICSRATREAIDYAGGGTLIVQ